MGKRNNEKKVKLKLPSTRECTTCTELRKQWKGLIKTTDREKAVINQLNDFTAKRKLLKLGVKGQSTLYRCEQCHHHWRFDFLDNCVPGSLSE